MIISPTYNSSMLFFSPLLWYQGERADLGFDPNTELSSTTGNYREIAYKKICGYEFYKEPLAHGCLVSRTLLGHTVRLLKENGQYSIQQYKTVWPNILRYGKMHGRYVPTFADPGTWTYAHHFKLPEYLYDTDDLINYYDCLQYDLAGSVDWPIIDRIINFDPKTKQRKFIELDSKTKEYRRNLTLDLAQDFINKCNKRVNLQFVPFGTIQGYSTESYKLSLRKLLKMGYQYVAIGGLPSYSEQRVVELLPMIWDEVKRSGYRPGIHLYGRFPSPKHVGTFLKYGVTSFDNNSSFIVASRGNCSLYHPRFLTSGAQPLLECYNINISPLNGPTVNRIKRKYGKDSAEYKIVCDGTSKAFRAFTEYCKNDSKKNEKNLIDIYKEVDLIYNDLSRRTPWGPKRLQYSQDKVERTLRDKPWKECQCTSCKLLGPHIALRRGHRIPHTFFHNTYIQFGRYLRELKQAEESVSYTKYDWRPVIELNKIKNERTSLRRKND